MVLKRFLVIFSLGLFLQNISAVELPHHNDNANQLEPELRRQEILCNDCQAFAASLWTIMQFASHRGPNLTFQYLQHNFDFVLRVPCSCGSRHSQIIPAYRQNLSALWPRVASATIQTLRQRGELFYDHNSSNEPLTQLFHH